MNSVGGVVVEITVEVALVLLVVFVRAVEIIYKHVIRKDVIKMVGTQFLKWEYLQPALLRMRYWWCYLRFLLMKMRSS